MIGMWTFVIAVAVYTAVAAALDLRMRRIPNYVTVPTALLGLTFHTLAPGGWGTAVALAGFGTGFAILFLPWLLGGSGMGDVKLLAALGSWLGPTLVLVAFAVSALLAACIALVVMLAGAARPALQHREHRSIAVGRHAGKTGRRAKRALPFAVPVALGTWAMLAWMASRGAM